MQHNETNANQLKEQEAREVFFAELMRAEGENLLELEQKLVNFTFIALENDIPNDIVTDLAGIWYAVNAYNMVMHSK